MVGSVGADPAHRGTLACFFQGLTCFLLANTSRSLQIFLRVVEGSMMSSTKPETKFNISAQNENLFWETVWKRTSDSRRERVGELLHIFSLGLSLVLLPSEDDLDRSLRKQTKVNAGWRHPSVRRRGAVTLAPMTATSAVGQA